MKNNLENKLQEFRENGYTIFRNVIDADLLKEVNQHLSFLAKKFPSLRPEHYHHPLIKDDAFWTRLVTDKRFLDIAQIFLGPDLVNFTAHYICKPAKNGQAVLWHQDGSYWNLDPMEAITLWLAVDKSNKDNGCLKVIPGSHRLPLQKLKLDQTVPNMLFSRVDYQFDTSKAVDIILEPGDVSVHNPFIIHGSEENTSQYRRCGLDMGFISTTTKIGNKDLYLYPILARGEAVPGINKYRNWPSYDVNNTIPFKGCESWNEYIKTKKDFGANKTITDDVMLVTQRMIDRLKEGSTAK